MKLFIPLSILLFFSPLSADSSNSLLTPPQLNGETFLSKQPQKAKIEELRKDLPPSEFNTLVDLISSFEQSTEKLFSDEENKELTCELIVRAHHLFATIKKLNLKAYFSDEFLQDLEFLSSLATQDSTLSPP